jgi:hypothetical protein
MNRTIGLIGTRDLAELVCWSRSGLDGVSLRAEAFTHTSDMPVMCVDERQEDLRATTEANRCEHQLCAASNATSKDFVAFRASKDKISAVWET